VLFTGNPNQEIKEIYFSWVKILPCLGIELGAVGYQHYLALQPSYNTTYFMLDSSIRPFTEEMS